MSRINWGLVERWRDELRSGNYQQGKRMLLSTDGKYCCLGVLEDKVMGTPKRDGKYGTAGMMAFGPGHTGILTNETKLALGLVEQVPCLFGQSASMLNDEENLTFDEIADLLDIAILEQDGIE